MVSYLAKILATTHTRKRSFVLAVAVLDILEANYLKPRSGYLLKLIGVISTGEVYLYLDRKWSYVGVETKVRVHSLTYSRKIPWLKHKLRVR